MDVLNHLGDANMMYTDQFGNDITAEDLGYIDGLNGYFYNSLKVIEEDREDYKAGYELGAVRWA